MAVSPLPNSDPSERIYVGDFVVGELPGNDTFSGQVISVTDENDPEYHVQVYAADGPRPSVRRTNREHITLHPVGRAGVIDDSSSPTETE